MSSAYARATVFLATPRSAASARLEGNWMPGSNRPERIASRMASITLSRTLPPGRSRCRSNPAAGLRGASQPAAMATSAPVYRRLSPRSNTKKRRTGSAVLHHGAVSFLACLMSIAEFWPIRPCHSPSRRAPWPSCVHLRLSARNESTIRSGCRREHRRNRVERGRGVVDSRTYGAIRLGLVLLSQAAAAPMSLFVVRLVMCGEGSQPVAIDAEEKLLGFLVLNAIDSELTSPVDPRPRSTW